jgi:hypothetical protein
MVMRDPCWIPTERLKGSLLSASLYIFIRWSMRDVVTQVGSSEA